MMELEAEKFDLSEKLKRQKYDVSDPEFYNCHHLFDAVVCLDLWWFEDMLSHTGLLPVK